MWLILSIIFGLLFIRLYTLCYINCNKGKYDKPGTNLLEFWDLFKSIIMLVISVFCLFMYLKLF